MVNNTLLYTDWIIISVIWKKGFVYRIAVGNKIFYGQWLNKTIDNSNLSRKDKNWIKEYFGFKTKIITPCLL